MPTEVEIKFRIADLRSLTRKLRALGFRLQTRRTFESNTLYDFPGALLRGRGELLRLRRYGKTWTVTHKGPRQKGRHKSRLETETQVQSGDKLAGVLQSLGLSPTFRYEKYRSEWSRGSGHVVLDETPIGNFGEIEGPPRWIDRTAKALGITSENYITSSYAELFFQWKDRSASAAREMTFRACKTG